MSSIYRNKQPYREMMFQPGSFKLVFEGADTDYSRVEFQVFHGQKEVSKKPRKKSTCYEPKLQSANTAAAAVLQAGEDEEFLKKFMQQFEFINTNYEKEKHGQMLCFGRFGKIFYPKYPPKSTMTIKELSRLIGPPAPKGFNPMFAPQSLSHDKVRSFLLLEGYQPIDCYSEYQVTLEIDEDHKEIILYLDENFDVKQVVSAIEDTSSAGSPDTQGTSANNIRWLVFNIKRHNLARLDLRFMFQSFNNTFPDFEAKKEGEMEVTGPWMRRYMSSKVIHSVDNDNVNIAESFKADVTFVRRKIVSNYKKPPVENAESKGFEATVFLMQVKQYACPNHFGRFTDVSNWTSEVVVLPVVPNTKDKEESAKFAKEFIRFCFSLENAAHQP